MLPVAFHSASRNARSAAFAPSSHPSLFALLHPRHTPRFRPFQPRVQRRPNQPRVQRRPNQPRVKRRKQRKSASRQKAKTAQISTRAKRRRVLRRGETGVTARGDGCVLGCTVPGCTVPGYPIPAVHLPYTSPGTHLSVHPALAHRPYRHQRPGEKYERNTGSGL